MGTKTIVISLALIVIFAILFIQSFKGNAERKAELNKKLDFDINLYNETKELSWLEVCAIINERVEDAIEREAQKRRIKALRELKQM